MKARTFLSLAAAALVALVAPVASAQNIELISLESFDYPAGADLDAQTGGIGLTEQWFAPDGTFGSAPSNAVITSPGFDAIGFKASTAVNNGGAFRKLSTLGWGSITFGDRFGIDNTTLWISFDIQRLVDDAYGGLSLNETFVGEKLFLGVPFQSNAFGLDSGGAKTAAGTNPDVKSRLVYRVDYLPGQERVRLYVDPAVPHPTSGEALDVQVNDHLFNEIRLQSGEGDPGVTGYAFDNIVFECQSCTRTSLVATPGSISVSAGGKQDLSLFAGSAAANRIYLLAGSASGTTPGLVVDGIGVPLNLDAFTLFTIAQANVPPFAGTFGLLDGFGQAKASITLPAGTSASLAGLSLDFAYVTLNTSLFVASASTSTNLTLLP